MQTSSLFRLPERDDIAICEYCNEEFGEDSFHTTPTPAQCGSFYDEDSDLDTDEVIDAAGELDSGKR
ncbi:hypothetical protein TorRG33x02_001880 [Trema orientale]|uniref:Uncharacterized protein n=1 Tax=Trema orientale TaxID=63057 RepID=A0A2P5G1F4_TREOI|nr:hypothetical protein TorRG33x02_001880 [Trema orientale]